MNKLDIFEKLQGHLVEYKTFIYNDKTYYIPYEDIIIDNELIHGLRNCEPRKKFLLSLFDEYKVNRETYLDIGCNLSFFVNSFSTVFKNVCGVDKEVAHINMARTLYPDIAKNLHIVDLNNIRLSNLVDKVNVITAMSMIEYINDKKSFVDDLYNISTDLVIVEGHSMDINNGNDKIYENLLKSKDWKVIRRPELGDNGVNAPKEAMGRPVWVCSK